jgi:PKD repeat protein
MTRLSTLDVNYTPGALSVFPVAIDNKDILYEVKNNASTILIQTLSYTSKIIVVEDTSSFPDTGLIRIGPKAGEPGNAELIYYGKKTSNTFQLLSRAYAGSRQSSWKKGSTITNAVMAEAHNSIKDATINIQNDIGVLVEPASTSLNGILKSQEIRFLSPKPLFRAFPKKGPSPLYVRFQNFTTGDLIKYLWEFGDGTTSTEESPIHIYSNEGVYSVKLTITTSTGGTGVVTKKNYITIDNNLTTPFFYVKGTPTKYSVQTASLQSVSPTEFLFVDQTDGDIVQRNWIFGDGEKLTVNDPNIHTATHIYAKPSLSTGYIVSLLVVFANNQSLRINLPENLVVL